MLCASQELNIDSDMTEMMMIKIISKKTIGCLHLSVLQTSKNTKMFQTVIKVSRQMFKTTILVCIALKNAAALKVSHRACVFHGKDLGKS